MRILPLLDHLRKSQNSLLICFSIYYICFFPFTAQNRFSIYSNLLLHSGAFAKASPVSEYYVEPFIGSYLSAENSTAESTFIAAPGGIWGSGRSDYFYYSDIFNCVIRKAILQSSTTVTRIVTVVGTGICGVGGLNLPALQADIPNPIYLWGDSADNLYFSDGAFRATVHKYSPQTGLLTRVAGNYTEGKVCEDNDYALSCNIGARGLWLNDDADLLFIADHTYARIITVDLGTGILNVLIAQDLYDLYDIKVINNNLYILQQDLLLMYDLNSSDTTTVAEELGSYGGTSLWVTSESIIFIPCLNDHTIRFINAGGSVNVFAGTSGVSGDAIDNTTATLAELNSPMFTYINTLGVMFISDQGNQKIRRVSVNQVFTLFGGKESEASFACNDSCYVSPNHPAFIFDPSDIWINTITNEKYFIEYSSHTIRQVSSNDRNITKLPISGIASPYMITGDSNGALYISDYSHDLIYYYRPFGSPTVGILIGSSHSACDLVDDAPSPDGLLTPICNPYGLHADSNGRIYFVESLINRVRYYDIPSDTVVFVAGQTSTLGIDEDNIPAIGAILKSPKDLWVDTMGDIFIVEHGGGLVRLIHNQTITTIIGRGLNIVNYALASESSISHPLSIVGDTKGNLFVASEDQYLIRQIYKNDSNYYVATIIGMNYKDANYGYSTSGNGIEIRVGGVTGLAIDSVGSLYFVEQSVNLIRKANIVASTVPVSSPTTVPAAPSNSMAPSVGPSAPPITQKPLELFSYYTENYIGSLMSPENVSGDNSFINNPGGICGSGIGNYFYYTDIGNCVIRR
eukprot:gene16160-18276_t